jgi:hypothetical protein
MANVMYPSAKKAFLDADIDLLVDTIKIALVDTGTVSYSAAHDFYDDISAGVIGTPATLGGKTTTAGVFDANDPTLTGVSGATVEALVVYKDSGVPGTSALILWYDTGVTGLTLTPNGGDVTITLHASGLFAL